MTEERHRVQVELDGLGPRQTATTQFHFAVKPQDAEDIRWYLEDFLEYPVDPAPEIAARVEGRLARLGHGLFKQVFSTQDAQRLWDRAQEHLEQLRVEVAGDPTEGVELPWELLRDSRTDVPVALRARVFVRTHSQPAQIPRLPEVSDGDRLRVLLVICRPAGGNDVPFRSVASRLVRSGAQAEIDGLDLDVLRPPTYAQLRKVLEAAVRERRPYQVVHFDGHGIYTDLTPTTNTGASTGGDGVGVVRVSPLRYTTVTPPRPGRHGYLLFERPDERSNQELVDGPTLGALLMQTKVPVLVLNACRSAYAEAPTQPTTAPTDSDTAEIVDVSANADAAIEETAVRVESVDVHARVRAYGSLAAEVADAGVPGVVAMRYNVYVVTAAQFIAELYAGLLTGRDLGEAVTAARRHLAADPRRQIAFDARPLQDWPVPLVFEAAPLALFKPTDTSVGCAPMIHLSPPERLGTCAAGTETTQPPEAVDTSGMVLPWRPDVGFHGRDETLLALDRAFDTCPVVLLHAFAGAGKTTTAAEFARWYRDTGGLDDGRGRTGPVLFTSFAHHRTLDRVLDQVSSTFTALLEADERPWQTRTPAEQRDRTLQLLAQTPVLWCWDNIEPITGFPDCAPTPWSPTEQHELAEFLRDLANTRAKVLITSRRDEQHWLGELPARVQLPPMPMRERLQLAQALATRHGQRLIEVAAWQPLLRYSAGNPLTLTVLIGHALRKNLTTRAEVQDFVDQLQTGHTQLETEQDRALGRSRSLAASLDYGFRDAFTEPERAQLAVLHLFRDTVDADALISMSHNPHRVPQLAGLTRERAINLLDRAADIGLLTPLGGGYYAIHPALPWYFTSLFIETYGPPDQFDALNAARSYATAYSFLGERYLWQRTSGMHEVIPALGAEEANLLHALRLSQIHKLSTDIGAAQGLLVLYRHQGRTVEWERIVDQLTPDLVDSADQPLPGREGHYDIIMEYRVRVAMVARDWPTAARLQHLVTAWNRDRAATALSTPPKQLDLDASIRIRTLALSLFSLGEILRLQDSVECIDRYQEAIELLRDIGDRRDQAIVESSLGNAYLRVPGIRDLDQAEQVMQRSLELLEDRDQLGRAEILANCAAVELERLTEARAVGVDKLALDRHFNNALRGYHQALHLYPEDAVPGRAVTHHQLGLLYAQAGDVPTALTHYQQAITHYEDSRNTFQAGETRFGVAVLLAQANRYDDALPWAEAAIRNFQLVGPDAAHSADMAQQLIHWIRQERDGPMLYEGPALTVASRALIGNDIKEELEGAGLAQVMASLYAADCQTCGRSLGTAPPTLYVDDFDSYALASLHHALCRKSKWNRATSGVLIVRYTSAPTRTWRSRTFGFPMTRPDGVARLFPMVLVNPSLESVSLERDADGQWQVRLARWFRDAGMVPPDGLRIGAPIDGATAYLENGDVVIEMIDHFASYKLSTSNWADTEKVWVGKIHELGGLIFAVTHAVNPAAVATAHDLQPIFAEDRSLMGWVGIRG